MITNPQILTYSELITIPTFEERFRYLKQNSLIGEETFGSDRWINQKFYTSDFWRRIRRDIILRDFGCDLGIYGREIIGPIIIHHMNPITVDDILERTPFAIDLEYLISTSDPTHKALHFGSEESLILEPTIRKPNDTCPWR